MTLLPLARVRSGVLRLYAIFSFILAIFFYSYIRDHIRFEDRLESLAISFDDFPSSYIEAMEDAVSHGTPIQYNHTQNFPDSNIPRIIHNIWFHGIASDDPKDVPEIWRGAQVMCRDANPDYEIRTWTEEGARELLQQHYAWFLPTYDQYNFQIQRVDALKYFVLFHYGGVYMDLDISCRRPLDPLLQFSAWFPRTKPMGLGNDLMAGTPQHPVFSTLINNLKKHNRNLYFTYLTVFWSTGPMFVNNVLKKWLKEQTQMPHHQSLSETLDANHNGRHRYTGASGISVLPQIFYTDHYSFFGHREGGSWHGNDVLVVEWIIQKLKWVSLFCLFGIGGLVLIRIMRKRARIRILRNKKFQV